MLLPSARQPADGVVAKFREGGIARALRGGAGNRPPGYGAVCARVRRSRFGAWPHQKTHSEGDTSARMCLSVRRRRVAVGVEPLGGHGHEALAGARSGSPSMIMIWACPAAPPDLQHHHAAPRVVDDADGMEGEVGGRDPRRLPLERVESLGLGAVGGPTTSRVLSCAPKTSHADSAPARLASLQRAET